MSIVPAKGISTNFNMIKKIYMKTTWTTEKHNKMDDNFMCITIEKNIPEHPTFKDGGYKVSLHSSSFYLHDLGHVKDLIAFLQEFVNEQTKGGEK